MSAFRVVITTLLIIGFLFPVSLAGQSMTQTVDKTIQLRIRILSCDWNKKTPESSESPRVIQIKEFDTKNSELQAGQLATMFPIQNLQNVGSGELTADKSANATWMAEGIMIRVTFQPALGPKSQRHHVQITFDDVQTNDSYSDEVSFSGNEKVVLMFQKRGGKKAIAFLLSLLIPQAKTEGYSTEYKTDRFTILSRDKNWTESGDQHGTMTFHDAKVVISIHSKDRFIFTAEEIIYAKGATELVGRNAVLLDCSSNQVVVEGSKLKITVEDDGVKHSKVEEQ